ncbi:MAG: tetratricopeptide repeat protein [Bacteroidota bacterium]
MTAKKSRKPTTDRTLIYGLLAILLATFIVHQPALQNTLLDYDDNRYVTDNPLIREATGANLASHFTAFYDGHYHPLTLTLLTAEYAAFELEPRGYHVVNLLLHLLNVWLVFLLISRLSDRKTVILITTALFGVATVQVESITWVSEQKNLLFTTFYLAALVAYVRHARQGGTTAYALAVAGFLVALLAKSAAIPLAVTILGVDLLLQRDFRQPRLWLEKAPFIALAIVFGLISIQAQQHTWGAELDVHGFSFIERVGFAGYAFTQYLLHTVVPFRLSAIYPYPLTEAGSMPAVYWAFALPVAGFLAAMAWAWKRSARLLFGLFFFAANIVLILKIFKVPYGDFVMADRYASVPALGIFYLLAVGADELMSRKSSWQRPVVLAIGVYLLALSVHSYRYHGAWQTNETLWTDVLEQHPDQAWIWNHRGIARVRSGNLDQGMSDLRKAIALDPADEVAQMNMGLSLVSSNRTQQALPFLREAVRLKSDFSEARLQLASAYVGQQRFALAMAQTDTVLQQDSLNAQAFMTRATLFGAQAEYRKAIEDYDRSLALDPNNHEAWFNRAIARDNLQDFDGAISDYSQAIARAPQHARAWLFRGIARNRTGDLPGAIEDYSRTILLENTNGRAHYLRAMAYRETGQTATICSDLATASRLGFAPASKALATYCRK